MCATDAAPHACPVGSAPVSARLRKLNHQLLTKDDDLLGCLIVLMGSHHILCTTDTALDL